MLVKTGTSQSIYKKLLVTGSTSRPPCSCNRISGLIMPPYQGGVHSFITIHRLGMVVGVDWSVVGVGDSVVLVLSAHVCLVISLHCVCDSQCATLCHPFHVLYSSNARFDGYGYRSSLINMRRCLPCRWE